MLRPPVCPPQERNERLFYYVMAAHTEELSPLLGEPTVSEYCLKYSLMFRRRVPLCGL